LIIVSLLAAFAVSIGVSASASASPIYLNCWHVGLGLGGFKDSQCKMEELGGAWARTYFTTGGAFLWCHYVGLGNGVFDDPNCKNPGGAEAFSLLRKAGVVVRVTGGTYTLKGKLAGATATIVCKKLKAKNPLITGGEPGLSEEEALEYTECASTAPTKCTVNSLGAPAGTIDTEPVDSELVENTAKTQIENRFLPKTGTKFVGVLYLDKSPETCVLKNTEFPIEGSSLTEVSPQGEEALTETLKSEPASKEYINSKGETKTAKLELGKMAATLEGTATVEVEIEGALELFGVMK
jgi:hypothetical protein